MREEKRSLKNYPSENITVHLYPVGIYLLKVNNRILEQGVKYVKDVFIVL